MRPILETMEASARLFVKALLTGLYYAVVPFYLAFLGALVVLYFSAFAPYKASAWTFFYTKLMFSAAMSKIWRRKREVGSGDAIERERRTTNLEEMDKSRDEIVKKIRGNLGDLDEHLRRANEVFASSSNEGEVKPDNAAELCVPAQPKMNTASFEYMERIAASAHPSSKLSALLARMKEEHKKNVFDAPSAPLRVEYSADLTNSSLATISEIEPSKASVAAPATTAKESSTTRSRSQHSATNSTTAPRTPRMNRAAEVRIQRKVEEEKRKLAEERKGRQRNTRRARMLQESMAQKNYKKATGDADNWRSKPETTTKTAGTVEVVCSDEMSQVN